jgi:hypothetical protein
MANGMTYFEKRMMAFAIAMLVGPPFLLYEWTDGGWFAPGVYLAIATIIGFITFRRNPSMSLSLSERQREESQKDTWRTPSATSPPKYEPRGKAGESEELLP